MASLSVAAGECVVGCASGYYNTTAVNMSCAATADNATSIAEFSLSGCVPGCTMPTDVGFYNLTLCPPLLNVGGEDIYPQVMMVMMMMITVMRTGVRIRFRVLSCAVDWSADRIFFCIVHTSAALCRSAGAQRLSLRYCSGSVSLLSVRLRAVGGRAGCMRACMRACVRACVHACVRACMRACVLLCVVT